MAVFGLSSLPKDIANLGPGDYLVRVILYHKIGKMQLDKIRNYYNKCCVEKIERLEI